MKFFAQANSQAPTIWATGNVKGTYTALPAMNVPVNLSGGDLTTKFNPQSWGLQTNKWTATITDGAGKLTGGSYTGDVAFKGAGAGSLTPSTPTSGAFGGAAKYADINRKNIAIFLFLCSFIGLNLFPASAQVLKFGVFDVQKIMRESKTINGYRQDLIKKLNKRGSPCRAERNS